MTKTKLEHIQLDEKGTIGIDNTNAKVFEVVCDHIIGSLSPARIHPEFPDLPLAQIHAALAYHYDHKEKLDAKLTERKQRLKR